jgi:hypothetical protein
VALSVGKRPCPNPNSCGPNSANIPTEYLKIGINIFNDHHLYTNSAGGKDEYAPGSLLSALAILNADPDDPFLWGLESVQVKLYPTFVSSKSALLWDYSLGRWKNYWYEDQNNYHSPPSCSDDLPCASGARCIKRNPEDVNGTCAERSMPVRSAGFLTAWIWEYLRGDKNVPICHPVRTPIGRSTMACCSPIHGCGDVSVGDDPPVENYPANAPAAPVGIRPYHSITQVGNSSGVLNFNQ